MLRHYYRLIDPRRLSFIAVTAICSLTFFASVSATASAGETIREFKLTPGSSVCFTYPQAATNAPMHIMVSISAENGGTQTPSALVSAIVNRDTRSHAFTWIGTNGDGTTKASTSLSGNVIALGAFSNFALMTCTVPGKSNQLELSQNAATTSAAIFYYVTMLY